MKEIWVDLKGFEGIYKISSFGRIKSFIGKEKFLKIQKAKIRKSGTMSYPKLTLKGKTYRIHRLVAENFIPNPENKLEVNHKNKNIDDNSINNLEWCTRNENLFHKLDKPNMNEFTKKITKEIKRLVIL